GIAVEGRIQVGAGIGHHVDPPDLEGRAVVVVAGRALSLPEVADLRPRQPLVSGHAMFDHMAEVDDPLAFKIRHDAIAPISSQMTLSAAEGTARCHQPLIAKPAAPNTFMAW